MLPYMQSCEGDGLCLQAALEKAAKAEEEAAETAAQERPAEQAGTRKRRPQPILWPGNGRPNSVISL